MGLNPFRDSNLNDLQRNIREYLRDHFGSLVETIRSGWKRFVTKGKERLTVMLIPHNEKKIVNFHVSIFTISIITGIMIAVIAVTSVMIINHSSTIKEVSKLKMYGTDSRLKIKKYKDEINKLYALFQKFKPEITHLYSLTPESDIDSLWAKGGIPNPEPVPGIEDSASDSSTLPMEVLNIEEVKNELKTTRELIERIKGFIKYRKQIIGNSPSIWPVDGYIISRFGTRSSPYTFRQEYHTGIDIESFPCADIRATAPGTVSEVRWDPVLGLTISIRHKYGFVTSYSHCQRVIVEEGQKISKGEVIGYVGKTGKTTRYICFYQIRIGTDFVDPIPYLNRISN